MRFYKHGFFILFFILVAGMIIFYGVRDNTQARLDAQVKESLELLEKGASQVDDGEYEEGLGHLERSLELNHLNAETYVYLGYAYDGLDNHQESYEYFVSALNMEAISEEIIEKVGSRLLNSGYYEEALIHLEYGVDNYPEDEELLSLLARAQLLAGEHENAFETARDLHEIAETEEPYLYLGMSSYYLGEKEQAGRYYINYLEGREDAEGDEGAEVDELHQKVLSLGGVNGG